MGPGPASPVAAYHCQNHPERAGVGVCVRCRRVLCGECATKIDRMNFCAPCLQAISSARNPAKRAAARAPGPVRGAFLLLLSYTLLAGIFAAAGLLIATWGVQR